MTPRRLRIAGAIGVAVGMLLIVSAGTVDAQESVSIDDSGWWSRANQDATIGGALVFPDVSPGQLLVEGTPEGSTAIAALRATLPEGTGSPVLTLHVASAVGADTAVLLACQAGSGWTGAHAGAWSAHPNPDCSQSVQGILSDDGTAFSFSLEALQFDDQVNVVLTPGLDPNGGESVNSAFRVVFERPTEAAIEVSDAPTGTVEFDAPALDLGDDIDSSGAAPVFGPAPSFSSSPSSSFTTPTFPTPEQLATQPAQAALPPDEQGQTATAPILSAANPLPPPITAASSTNDGRLLGVLVVLCAAGLLYWSTQQPVPEHRVLSRFATAAAGAETGPDGAVGAGEDVVVDIGGQPEQQLGGLGRFRRVRTTPARRLGG